MARRATVRSGSALRRALVLALLFAARGSAAPGGDASRSDSPSLPQGTYEVTLAGKTHDMLEIRDERQSAQLQLAGYPPAPIPGWPLDAARVSAGDVYFNWRDGAGAPRAEFFRLCIVIAGGRCGDPGALLYPVASEAAIHGTRYEPAGGLPYRLQGQQLEWKVGACAYQTALVISGQPAEVCTYAPPRRLDWTFPVVSLLHAVIDDPEDPQSITFSWSHGSPAGASYFKLCMAEPGQACGTPGLSRVVEIHDPTVTSYTMGNAVTFAFEGRYVHWTVGLCNVAGVCQWADDYGELTFPYSRGSFGRLLPAFAHEKCTNCHAFENPNAKYQQHVQAGRFAAGTDVTNEANCTGCHNPGTGYPEHWRSPGIFGSFEFLHCDGIREGRVDKWAMRDHLQNDPLVRWGIDRIPGLTGTRWNDLTQEWFESDMRCIGEYPRNTYGNPWYL